MAKTEGPVAIKKYEDRLLTAKEREGDGPSRRVALSAALSKMQLDPEVTRRTLGAPHAQLGPAAIIATTQKLLRLSRGEDDVDDRT